MPGRQRFRAESSRSRPRLSPSCRSGSSGSRSRARKARAPKASPSRAGRTRRRTSSELASPHRPSLPSPAVRGLRWRVGCRGPVGVGTPESSARDAGVPARGSQCRTGLMPSRSAAAPGSRPHAAPPRMSGIPKSVKGLAMAPGGDRGLGASSAHWHDERLCIPDRKAHRKSRIASWRGRTRPVLEPGGTVPRVRRTRKGGPARACGLHAQACLRTATWRTVSGLLPAESARCHGQPPAI